MPFKFTISKVDHTFCPKPQPPNTLRVEPEEGESPPDVLVAAVKEKVASIGLKRYVSDYVAALASIESVRRVRGEWTKEALQDWEDVQRRQRSDAEIPTHMLKPLEWESPYRSIAPIRQHVTVVLDVKEGAEQANALAATHGKRRADAALPHVHKK